MTDSFISQINKENNNPDHYFLSYLMDNTTDMIWMVDKNYVLVNANRAFLKGMADSGGGEARIGQRITGNRHNEKTVAIWHEIYQRGFKGESFRAKTKDEFAGILRTMLINIIPYTDPDGSVGGIILNSHDITEEEQLREKLMASEALRKSALDSITDNVSVVDKKGNIITVNEPWRKFGLENGITETNGTIENINYLDVLLKADLTGSETGTKKIAEKINQVLDGSLSTYSTEYECSSPTEERWFQMIVMPLLSDEGGAVITHRNITESKLSERKIRESEQKYRFIAENMSDVIWTMNLTEQKLVYISSSVEKLRGYTPEEVMAQPWLNQATPRSQKEIQKLLPELVSNFMNGDDGIITYEVEQPCKNGQVVWTEVTGHFQFDLETGNLFLFGSSRDITDKKRLLDKVRISESRFSKAFRYAGLGFCLIDMENRFFMVNEAFCQILGYQEEELLLKTYFDITHPDDLAITANQEFELLIGKIDCFRAEKRYFRKDGSEIFVDIIVTMVRDENLKPQFRIAQIQDITQQKENNRKILEDQKTFRILNKFLSDYLFKIVFDPEGKPEMSILAGNYPEATGRSIPEASNPGDWHKFIHKDDLASLMNTFKKIQEDKVPHEIECRSYAENGQMRWLEIVATPDTDPETGNLLAIYGSVRNITERRQSELQLKKLSLAVEQSPASILITDLAGNIEYVNQGFIDVTGYSSGEVRGKNPNILRSEYTPDKTYHEMWNTLLSGNTWQGELMNRKKGGELYWEIVSISPIKNKDGVVTNYLAVNEDITENKRTENLLLDSEKKYRTLFETMAQGVVYQDSNGYIISANQSAEEILGLTLDQMCGRSSMDSRWRSVREDGSDFPGQEHPAMVALGTGNTENAVMGVFHPREEKYRWINVTAIPEFTEGETRPYRVCSTFEDITRIKEMMIELNNANKLLETRVEERTREIRRLSYLHEAILKHAGLGIIATNPGGTIELFNQAAEKMLGYKASEVIGLLSPTVFHEPGEVLNRLIQLAPDDRHTDDVNFDLFIRIIALSPPDPTEWTYIRKDGTRFPSTLTLTTLRDEDENIIGYMGIAMDVTREKNYISSLKESEERFHRMFFDHAAIMWLIDPESGDIMEANQAARQFYGYNFNADIKINLRDVNLIEPGKLKQAIDKAAMFHENHFSFRHKLFNGETRDVEVHSTPILVRDKTILFSIIHDVSDRMKAEQLLLNSEKENRAIVTAIPDFLFRIGIDGTFLHYHSLHENPLCNTHETLVGKHVTDMFPAEMAEKTMVFIRQAIDSGEMVAYEYDLVIENETRYFENRLTAIAPDAVLSIHRDITERKLAEKYLTIQRDFATRMSLVSDPDDAMNIALDTLMSLDGLDCGGIYSIDPDEKTMVLKVHRGLSDDFLRQKRNYPKDAPQTQVVMQKRAIFSNLGKLFPEIVPTGTDDIIRGLAILPVLLEDTVIGVVNVASFTHEEIPLIMHPTIEAIAMSMGLTLARISAEASHLASKRNFQLLFDTLDDFMFILDSGGNIMLTNPVVQNRLGYTHEELTGMNVLEIHPPERRKEAATIVEEMLRGEAQFCPVPLITKSGMHIPVETRVIMGQWDDRPVLYGISRDITERQKAEAQLRLQSAAFESFALAIIITDTHGKISWANTAYSRLTGYSMEEILGKTPGELQKSGKHDHHFYKEFWNTILEKRVYTGEIINRRKNNTEYYEEVTITPMIDYKDEIYGFIAIKIDITDRKRMENSLLQSIEREKELNELKSKFISVASHEFRTPLATILASSESLITYSHRMSPEQQKSRLFKIKNKVTDLNNIIEEILHLSKMQARQTPLSPDLFNLVELFRECLDEFRSTYGDKVNLVMNAVVDCLGVYLDKKLIKMAFNNLVSNAIKYSEPGSPITVDISNTGNFICFSVSDKGIGIPEEDVKHLFEPFFRASNAINLSGTGLGLNIVKETVERHGGKVTIRSKINEGTEFSIILPESL